jgi:TolB protein
MAWVYLPIRSAILSLHCSSTDLLPGLEMPPIAVKLDQEYQPDPIFDTDREVVDFAYRTIKGDFIFTVELRDPTQGGAFGLQVEFGDTALQTQLDERGELHVATLAKHAAVQHAEVFQVERHGDTLTFSAARFGEPLAPIASTETPADQVLRVGVYRHPGVTLRNARWTAPAWPGLVPYTDYLGSRLELLDVDTGVREVIFATAAGIEAPNFTLDGAAITFNSGGCIYRFELAIKTVSEIDTGTCIRNNNDHVISPDGKWLGISHHAAEFNGESIVYKLPIDGGEPVALTHKAPSYLHGWSLDGKYVIYTAGRNGHFHICRTTTDGVGEETPLTNGPGLDDGSEYSPDGTQIYFNSTRTGVMQLWRMGADGSAPEQLTHDSFNNWFPHVSPDNRRIVFLSYLPSMQADQHPYYQPVYLRTMPVDGGPARVLAYLYGGQGTINVPSWSPDGKRVAFVSHTGLL